MELNIVHFIFFFFFLIIQSFLTVTRRAPVYTIVVVAPNTLPFTLTVFFLSMSNTCGVFTVNVWRFLTELDLSNPAPTTKTQLKLDLCMKYTLILIYFINQCVLASHQLDRTHHSLGVGGASVFSSNPTSRVKACILGKMSPKSNVPVKNQKPLILHSDSNWLNLPVEKSWQNMIWHWFESHLPMLAQRATLWVFCVGKGS